MSYPITRHFVLPFLKKYITSIKGQKNLPEYNPFIVAANHISQTDPFFIFTTLFPKYKKKIHFIANRGNYGSIFERLIASKWAGCILLDPKNKKDSVKKAIKLIEKNKLVGIFPEGERVPDSNDLRRGKTGVIRIALESKVPILPIGIITKGEKHRIKRGDLHSLGWDALNHYGIKGHRTKLVIGKPISLEKYYNQPVTYELLRKLTNLVMEELAKLSGKQYNY